MENSNKTFRGGNRSGGTKRSYKSVGFIALLILFALIGLAFYGQRSMPTIPLTQAVSESNQGRYTKIEVSGNQLDITKKGDKSATVKTYKDPNASLKDEGFDTRKVEVAYKPQSST